MAKDVQNHNKTHNYAVLASLVALTLGIVKFSLFWISGSLLIALSAWDSAVDSLISLLNSRVLRYARQEADADHPYGHGKAESIMGLVQAGLILGGGFTIVLAAIRQLMLSDNGPIPDPSDHVKLALFFLGAALASWILYKTLRYQATAHRSPALLADAAHYQTDAVTNSGTAIALIGVMLWPARWLDPLLGIGFALVASWGGIVLARESIDQLMDKELPTTLQQRVLSIIGQYPDILDIHRFRGRLSGHVVFLDFHIALPASLTFSQAHRIADTLERHLKQELQADVTIHYDPRDGES